MAPTILKPKPDLIIDSGDAFYIENHHKTNTIVFGWAKREYAIAPGKKRLVPFDVVTLCYGDPRSRVGQILSYSDSTGSGQIPDRNAEVQRLSVRYGVYEQGMEDIKHWFEVENRKLIEDDKPPMNDAIWHTKVTTETGEEVMTPLFDHSGTSSNYGYSEATQRSDDVATMLENLRSRIDYLEAQKDSLDELGGENDDEGVEFDNPDIP
jgi:hypothetical protein